VCIDVKVYYNEFDPKAAAWLRQLIVNGDITDGVVDERSITEVTASDLEGFDRVHFFAGIGTWDYCLSNGVIGDNGRLAVKSKADMQYYKVKGNEYFS